ncbi:haloalkane dehalogenase [Nocardioides sp.]|uniref:alpha/beta hydrolase n=1 Tax=Nocardioides sp. TaxID=35761 RepID=UPI0026319310|nr:haloalkane dehalogenase [Nocardioides sp.]
MIPTITAARLSGAVDREQHPLLVLGPAAGATALDLWVEVAAELGDAVDVVAWDLPGHGYNAPLATVDGDEGYDLSELAAGVTRVVDDLLTQRGDLGAACFYAGVGIGGEVGTHLAVESPERVLASLTLDDVAPGDRAQALRRDLLGEDDPTPYGMPVHRTPDARFVGLPDYPFAPRYVDVAPADEPDLTPVRMHYLDEGPPDGSVVLLLHGQPTWSYLYRHVVPVLVEAGLRVIAPDNIGFGRSDKPASPYDYTLARHVGWIRSLVTTLDLREITLVAQDWGGPIGFSALAEEPDRFARVVAANTILHTADPDLAGRIEWAVHGDGDSRVVIEESLLDYLLYTQRAPELRASDFVGATATTPLSKAVLAAYDAPFPTPEHTAGLRQMTALLPLTRNDPGARIGRRTMRALEAFDRPFVTAYSDGDPATRGWETVFAERVPGARGQEHVTIAGAGHFLQEDAGAELGRVIVKVVTTT